MKKRTMVSLFFILLIVAGSWLLVHYYSYSGPVPDPPCPPGVPVSFENLPSRTEGIIGRYHAPDRPLNSRDLKGYFSVTGTGPADLYGSADMAYILWILGELNERTTTAGRAEWAAFINSFQNPETGLFDRSGTSEESVVHATAFATAALKLLGHRPRYPLKWAEKVFESPASIERWLDAFYWNQIWTGSHEAGAAAAVLDAPWGLKLPPRWQQWLLDDLTRRVDPATGFWKQGITDRVIKSATTVDLGGAAHFWWLYRRIGRPIPHPEKVLTGIMSLQKKSGIWGNRLFNGPLPQGIDLDAINGMRLAWKELDPAAKAKHRERLVRVLEKYACALHYRLGPEDSFLRLFTKAHKLVGTLNAMAELDIFYRELTGKSILNTPKPLRSSLEKVAWQ